MMSAKKRMISVILIFVMVIGMCATACTADPDSGARDETGAFTKESVSDAAGETQVCTADPIPDIAGVTEEDYMKEVEDTIKGYLRARGMNASGLSMSQPMPVDGADVDNYRAIFLFRDKKCVGLMALAYVDNEYASSFAMGDYPAITDALNKNISFALVSGENYMIMITDDDWAYVSGLEDFAEEDAINKTGKSYEKQVLSLTPLVFSDEDLMYDDESNAEERS